ncbi:MAG: aminopeptidase [Phycisphaerales bacterium]|nr:MAG: aminopeptidase [Phycisphaerales bacterium]
MSSPTSPPTETLPPNEKAPAGAISPDRLRELRREVESRPTTRLARHAVAQTSVQDVALNRDVVTQTAHTFSHHLDDWPVTDQKNSGRCWMFAGLNLLRAGAMQKMNLKEFEFSQNYTLFWDKFERANYFLEAIIETADRDVDDRVVAFLLERPLEDGGQWNMFTNLIRKYGLVPKSAMPETESSSNTRRMNGVLLQKLREAARTLREAKANGATKSDLGVKKDEYLDVIFRMLVIHLGMPPERFDWQWMDKDRKFHRHGAMTPQEFAKKFITIPYDEYVCIVHDPRPSSPFGRTFTVEYLGNIIEGGRVIYLNAEIDLMKKLTMQAIEEGEPVWMGCDVGQMMRSDLGIWDAKLYDYETLYDTEFTLNKADRLLYHQTQMTHAMLFTGVDIVDGHPRRWRVENSWSDKDGQKGFYTMNDSWFDEYMFEIAAPKSSLPPELQRALSQEPIVLPAWDPMGALAR